MRGESSVLTQRVRLHKNISASSQRVSSRSTVQAMTLLYADILTHFDTLASVKRHVSKVETSGQKPLGLRLPTVCCSTCHARSDRWLANVRKVSQPRSGNQTLGFPPNSFRHGTVNARLAESDTPSAPTQAIVRKSLANDSLESL